MCNSYIFSFYVKIQTFAFQIDCRPGSIPKTLNVPITTGRKRALSADHYMGAPKIQGHVGLWKLDVWRKSWWMTFCLKGLCNIISLGILFILYLDQNAEVSKDTENAIQKRLTSYWHHMNCVKNRTDIL